MSKSIGNPSKKWCANPTLGGADYGNFTQAAIILRYADGKMNKRNKFLNLIEKQREP